MNNDELRQQLFYGLATHDVERAALATAWLVERNLSKMAWATVAQYMGRYLCGSEHAPLISSFYQCWRAGYEDDNLFAAVATLCGTTPYNQGRQKGRINRVYDELKNAAIYWMQSSREFEMMPEPITVCEPIKKVPGELPLGTVKGKWHHSLAVSSLHKALRRGDLEMCGFTIAWLGRYERGIRGAWGRMLALPSEDMGGQGTQQMAALHLLYSISSEPSLLYAGVIYLCGLVAVSKDGENVACWVDQQGRNFAACQLMETYTGMMARGESLAPPAEAYDVHTGNGRLADFWAYVNRLGPASPWREDAMLAVEKPRQVVMTGQPGLFD